MSTGTIVEPVFNHVVDQVDKAAESAIKVIDLTQAAAFATVEQVTTKVGAESEGLVVEVRAVKDRLIALPKAYGDAVTSALP